MWVWTKVFFKKRGFKLDLRIYNGGPELLEAVQRGEAEVGEIGMLPLCLAYSQGAPIRVIGSGFIQKLDHFLAAIPSIKTLAELKGKRVGLLSLGSCDDYLLQRMMQSVGLDWCHDLERVAPGAGLRQAGAVWR